MSSKAALCVLMTALLAFMVGTVCSAQDFLCFKAGSQATVLDRFTSGGATVGTFGDFPVGCDLYEMRYDSSGNLYVADYGVYNGKPAIHKLNGTTGELIADIAPGPLGNPAGPVALTIGGDGKLYTAGVAPAGTTNVYVYQYDLTTGTYVGQVYLTGTGTCFAMATGPDGDIYVETASSTGIARLSMSSGYTMEVWKKSGILGSGRGMVFGPDGNLYVVNRGYSSGPQVMKVNPADGTCVPFLVGKPAGGGTASDIAFLDDGTLIMTEKSRGAIEQYQGPGGASPGAYIKDLVIGYGYNAAQCLVTMPVSSPVTSITVTPTLENFSGDLSLSPVKVTVTGPGGTVTETLDLSKISNTSWTFTGLAPGEYTVRAKANVFLARSQTATLAAGQPWFVNLVLPNGDLDGNGTIDTSDFESINTGFGDKDQ
jgi:hypothetical protein